MSNNNNLYKEIHHNGTHVATHVIPTNSKPGLNFITNDDKYLQLGIWNYEKNHKLPAHYHNEFPREALKTNEFVFVLSGKLKCDLYTEEGEYIETIIANNNEGIIQHNFTHKYTILEKSIILESKNGPFFGVEKDKTVIQIND